MTNDTTILNGALSELGETMADNLVAMGVLDATASDGLTTLANKILQVQGGVVIDTSVSIIPTVYSVLPGESVTVNGVLSALYDGTVDLVGQLGGGTIKIYDGDTLVDTVTTNASGAFTSTFTLTGFGEHFLKAVFDGVANVFDDCESSAVVVYCTNTVITLNVPMSLIYSDAFSITGVLKDTSNNVLANKTVRLLVGGTCVDTDTTDNNGEFSFTRTPVHMGTHSFQISWEGDVTYYPTVSSIVTREIDKETSVLNVSSPTTNQNVYSDGSLSVAGTLQSDDAEAIAGASVLVKQDGTTLTTLTTDSNGAFTGNVNASNLDTGNLDILFESNSTHTASSASISIVVNDPTLTLVTDKSILSYVDSESATLTATYAGANVSGKTVSFDVVSGGVVVENIGTATTDSNGQASVSYQSKDAGNINIRCSVGNVESSSVSIEDCNIYRTTEYTHTTTNGDSATAILNNHSFDASGDFELTVDYYQSGSGGCIGVNPLNEGTTVKYHFVYGQTDGQTAMYYGNSSGTESASRHNETAIFNQYFTLKFIKENGVMSIYRNDTLYDSLSNSEVGKHGNMVIAFTDWISGKTLKAKNIKLKNL